MDKLERHSYAKIDGEWKITKTITLSYEKIPYTLSTVLALQKKLEEVLTPDLLTPKYREENETNPMYGHCYHTTQAVFYLLDSNTLDPMSAKDYRGDTHWWLKDRESGMVIDMTSDQYYSVGQEPPHHKGKVSKWYGFKSRVHKRSMTLIQKIQKDATMDTWVADHLTPS